MTVLLFPQYLDSQLNVNDNAIVLVLHNLPQLSKLSNVFLVSYSKHTHT